ncbi:MAG: nucleotidyltransferase domain-containing protein [Clostridia bacterium]|nr:nucleotidyltransferase domain-containing protein [Clostridia bacterium]
MIYTIDEIKERVIPVAKKYSLRAVYVFGSYARNEATDQSDVDILIDRTGSSIKGMFDMGNLYHDLRESIGLEIDLVTTHTLKQRSTQARIPAFVEALQSERIQIYG